MRQLTCTAPNSIAWQDVPEPRLQGDDEALVRPLAVARCDIDLFLTCGLFPSRGPFALGHEGIAEIVELGDAVRGLEVGAWSSPSRSRAVCVTPAPRAIPGTATAIQCSPTTA